MIPLIWGNAIEEEKKRRKEAAVEETKDVNQSTDTQISTQPNQDQNQLNETEDCGDKQQFCFVNFKDYINLLNI